jgi:hypothetical protein
LEDLIRFGRWATLPPATERRVHDLHEAVVLAQLRRRELAEFQLDLLAQLTKAVAPEEIVQIALAAAEGPAQGVFER